VNHPANDAERLAQLRALVDAYVVRGQDLRTLHKQCMALLQDTGMSTEQRRAQLQQILRAEQDVLDESLHLHHQLVAILRGE
jgi:hypothetical protein